MARIFDVVEYPSEMIDEIVHRFPETGVADLRIGSQVIVRESQRVVFFRDGKALDVLGPGRHTIVTANIPKLIDLIGKAFNDRTPFTAEVYFVSMREFADRKWGTPQPIIVRNPGMGLGVALLQGFGTYSFQVNDPQQFVTQIVGAQGVYTSGDIENRLRTMLLSKLQDLLGETGAKHSIPEMIGLTEELGAGVRAKSQDDFLAVGLTLKSFYIGNLKPSDKSAEELRAMGMLDIQTYTQLQAADAMREAAQNPSGGAGLTAGIGAGMGIGGALQQSLAGMSKPAVEAAAAAMPDVMSPAEVASFLKVSEEDILASIKSGELKAKKIGEAYRISKSSIEAFLKG
ncbi:MAG: SPFH domain-containing protein [Anaerolineaceae bacterium]|nr:SPFH domain-containing protein [Anaerolineaceae bacterium]MBN2677176.1 SPFH domain-containing protein [Anaerolineaceae bacterium]